MKRAKFISIYLSSFEDLSQIPLIRSKSSYFASRILWHYQQNARKYKRHGMNFRPDAGREQYCQTGFRDRLFITRTKSALTQRSIKQGNRFRKYVTTSRNSPCRAVPFHRTRFAARNRNIAANSDPHPPRTYF